LIFEVLDFVRVTCPCGSPRCGNGDNYIFKKQFVYELCKVNLFSSRPRIDPTDIGCLFGQLRVSKTFPYTRGGLRVFWTKKRAAPLICACVLAVPKMQQQAKREKHGLL
jgi:hypothetical protein